MSSPSAARFYPFFAKCPFSQHWHCRFTVDELEFTAALQYMLYEKARLLDKHDVAKKIQQASGFKDWELQSRTIRLSEDEEKQWEASLMGTVRKANTAKFIQNDSLKKQLLSTADSILVYADPRDHLLGVGLKEGDPAIRDQSKWHGQNILGNVLMEIRDELLAKGERGEPAQNPSKLWKVGDECMSPWSGDNRPAKAVIVKIDEANQACVVKYDYDGSTEPRDLSMLSPVKFDRRAQKRQSSDGGRYRNQRSHENWDADGPSRFEADEASDERFTFFWQAQSPFSQWYVSKFEVDGVHYNCAEQFMMHQKALTFQDHQKATEIMDAWRPVHQKELGRQVSGYDEEKWNAACKEIVKRGNMAKFTQNRELLDELLDTAGTVLVEASPVDRKWGIGLAADDSRAKRRRTWKGENLLGQCLTEVRDEILEKIKGGSFVMPASLADTVKEAPEGYTLFWRSQSPFSQWYPARFTKDDVTYNCAEQYMMYKKAMYFNDNDAAYRILRETDPPKQKQIARGVKGFDETKWNKVSQGVVKDGSREKYTQNHDLRRELFATANTVLVEASKDDFRWGIGSTKDDPMSWNRRTWRGENWLGQILTEVRDELMQKEWPHPGLLSPRSHAGISYRAFSLPQSPFHMFHPCKIVDEERTFNSAGHWLLFARAGFAQNTKLAAEILNAEDAEQLTAINKQFVLPAEQQQAWESGLRKMLGKIITSKLDQNADIKQKLMETGSDCLVFAAAEPPLGTDYRRNADDNWLGKMLMQIREKLIESTNFYGPRTKRNFQRTAPEEHWETSPSEKISSSSEKSLADHVTQALEHKTTTAPNNSQDTRPSKVQNDGWAPRIPGPAQCSTGSKQPAKSEKQKKNQPGPATEKQEDVVFSNKESPFHLWYPAPMIVDDIRYACAGQCLLHLAAAQTFGDAELASKILDDTDESDYTAFENNCKDFTVYEWRNVLSDDDQFLYKANYEKFHQNRDLRAKLIATRDARMVFASKEDRNLGTGCGPDDEAVSKTVNWRGRNWLGKSLMKVREKLASEFQPKHELETSQPTSHAADSGRRPTVQECQSEVAGEKSKNNDKHGGWRKNKQHSHDLAKDTKSKKGKAVLDPTNKPAGSQETDSKPDTTSGHSGKPPKETSRHRNTVNHGGKASQKIDHVSKVPEESQAAVEESNREAEECQEETTAALRSDIPAQTVDTDETVAAGNKSAEVPFPLSSTGEISDADRLQTVPEPSHPAEDSSAGKSDGKERSEVSDEGNAEKVKVETSSPRKQTDENVSSEVEASLAVNQESGVPCESDSHPLVPSPANLDAGSPVPEGASETEAQGDVEETVVAQSEATSEASLTNAAVADQTAFGGEPATASTSDAVVPSQTDREQSTEILQKETIDTPETTFGMATPDSEAVAAGQQENLTEEDKEKSCPEASPPAADNITTEDAILGPEQTSGELAPPPQHKEKEATVAVTAEANGTEVETSEEEKPRDANLPDASSDDVLASQISELAVSDSAARTSFVADQDTPSSPGAELKLSDKSDEETTKDEMSEKIADNVAVDMESESKKPSSCVPAAEADDVASSTSQPGLPSTNSDDVSGIESNRDIGLPDVAGESQPEVNGVPVSTNNADVDNGKDETQNGENAPGISSSAASSDAESHKLNENNASYATASGLSAESTGTCDIGSCPGTTDVVKTDPGKESVVTSENHSMSCETGSVDLRMAGSGNGDVNLDSSKPNSSDLASKQSSSGDEINC